MLNDRQIGEFAERGFIVVPGVVGEDVLERASRRVDEIVAADPPDGAKRGSHFSFLPTAAEPALLATLTDTPAFALAEQLAGPGTLEVPWQVQVALNIPPYAHRPGRPHIDAANPEPVDAPMSGTFTLLAGILMSDQLVENSGNLWAPATCCSPTICSATTSAATTPPSGRGAPCTFASAPEATRPAARNSCETSGSSTHRSRPPGARVAARD